MDGINPNKHPSYYKISQGKLVKAPFFSRIKTRWSRSHLSNVASLFKNDIEMVNSQGLDPSSEAYLSAHRFNHLDRSLKFFRSLETLPYFEGVPRMKPDLDHIRQSRLKGVPENQFPYIKERRRIKLYHYSLEDSQIRHVKKGFRIFFGIQKERFLSFLGKKIQTFARLFRRQADFFDQYHYFGPCTPDDEEIYAQDSPLGEESVASSYWLGHASCFLSIPVQTDQGNTLKINLITDPIEGDLVKGLYPRMTKIPRPLDTCQAPQIYLLSHNHLDHFSRSTIKKLLKYQPIMLVPEGDGKKFKSLGFKHIYENNWWQTTEIPFTNGDERTSIRITTVPSKHWSKQGIFDKHQALFMGAVIHQEAGDIYFAGDTARLSDDHIATLRRLFNVRVQFQPGGPDENRKEMQITHQSSADALWMHFNLILQALYDRGGFADRDKGEFLEEAKQTRTLYMHTKTFKLGNLHYDDTDQSLFRIKKAFAGEEVTLKDYEQQVCDEICAIAQSMPFKDGKTLETADLLLLLEESVILPKIGSRTPLI